MSVIVRSFEPGASIKLISRALKSSESSIADSSFVCVGDSIDTDEPDYLKCEHLLLLLPLLLLLLLLSAPGPDDAAYAVSAHKHAHYTCRYLFYVPNFPPTLLSTWALARGHGTALIDGRLVATLCGIVQRIDKLIYVQPVKSR